MSTERRDRNRAESPLRPASDAVILDSTAMTLDEVLAVLEQLPDVDRTKVLLMPEGVTREELNRRGPWLAEVCLL